jgi:hypothetical protein
MQHDAHTATMCLLECDDRLLRACARGDSAEAVLKERGDLGSDAKRGGAIFGC